MWCHQCCCYHTVYCSISQCYCWNMSSALNWGQPKQILIWYCFVDDWILLNFRNIAECWICKCKKKKKRISTRFLTTHKLEHLPSHTVVGFPQTAHNCITRAPTNHIERTTGSLSPCSASAFDCNNRCNSDSTSNINTLQNTDNIQSNRTICWFDCNH